METYQLEAILQELIDALQQGSDVVLPNNVPTYEKFERRALKLKDSIELELEERAQVDNVIGFFTNNSNFSDDATFFNIDSQKVPLKSTSVEDIDPQHVLDDVQSNFSQAVSTDSKEQSVFQGKQKMSKKDLAAFMKAKLSQTKISNEVTT